VDSMVDAASLRLSRVGSLSRTVARSTRTDGRTARERFPQASEPLSGHSRVLRQGEKRYFIETGV